MKLHVSLFLLTTVFAGTSMSIDNINKINYSDFTVVDNSTNNNYINDEAFKYIKLCYADIDFSSTFNQGDLTTYEFYKQKYLQLLSCKTKFTDKNNNKYYINEYKELNLANESESFNPSDYIYYFFDADNDGNPELCITDETRFIYIMKYKADTDEIVLWHEPEATYTKLLGSRKLWFYSMTSPIYYRFYQLDEAGEIKCKVTFYVEARHDETIYMLTLPFENTQTPDYIQKQSIKKDSGIYYQVTEEQWHELTENYFKNKELSKENIKEVTFTFDELFESIN